MYKRKHQLRYITNLGGIADGEQPCKHTGIAVNGQDSKHPGQPQQGKENDSGLQGGPDNINIDQVCLARKPAQTLVGTECSIH